MTCTWETAQTNGAARATVIRPLPEPGATVTMTIDRAGREATISINEKMTAEGIDQLLRGLSQLRRRMIPEVAMKPDIHPEAATERTTALWARISRSGSCELRIRDAGLGWIACHLPVEAVVILQDGFRQAVSSLPLDAAVTLTFDSSTRANEEW